MNQSVFRFEFEKQADLTEVEATLQLAILAAQGLFGEACVRTEVAYHLDTDKRVVLLDGRTTSGEAVVRIFTAFITREFGDDAFHVRRTSQPITPQPEPAAAAG